MRSTCFGRAGAVLARVLLGAAVVGAGLAGVLVGARRLLGVLLVGLLAAACVSAAPGSAHRATRCGRAGRAPAARTVDDAALGVTWLADADLAATDTFNVSGISCDGSMGYATALKWVEAMNHADYLTADSTSFTSSRQHIVYPA